MRKRIKKYAYGTGSTRQGIENNYLETPAGELAEHNINIAKAQENAASNPWTQGMQMLGGAAMDYGLKNFAGFGGVGAQAPAPEMAYGGTTGTEVEVEGKEVGKLPNGEMLEFQGPTHEQGGIDVNLPGGTDIFSDRIKVKGKTMAAREKARVKTIKDLKKKLEDNPTDRVLTSTLEQVEANNAKEQMRDKQVQEVVNNIQNMNNQTFAFGTGTVGVIGGVQDAMMNAEYKGMNSGEEGMGNQKNLFESIRYALNTNKRDKLIAGMSGTEFDKTGVLDLYNRSRRGELAQFAMGGPVPGEPEEPVTPEPTTIETYRGADNYQEYQNWEAANKQYSAFSGLSNTLLDSGKDFKDEGIISPEAFKSRTSGEGFDYNLLPEGATGVQVLTGSTDVTDVDAYQAFGAVNNAEGMGQFWTKDGTTYIPSFDKPEGNYSLVDSPEVKEEKANQAAWQEETQGIQGYVRNTYYDPQCNCNQTELVPLQEGLDIPTNGVFVPKGDNPPPDWKPKMAYGGPVSKKMAHGGTVDTDPPFDMQQLFAALEEMNGGPIQTTGNAIPGFGYEADPNSFVEQRTQVYSDDPSRPPGTPLQRMDDSIEGFSMNTPQGKAPAVGTSSSPTSGSPELPATNMASMPRQQAPGNRSTTPVGSTGLPLMDDSVPSFSLNTPAGNKSPSTPTSSDGRPDFSGATPGNVVGMAGNAISTFAPLLNTLENRAGDTPNINAYKGYGERGLDTINESKNFLDDTKDARLLSLNQSEGASRKRNRNSARGVNTMRALDLATDVNSDNAESQINANFGSMMASIMGQEAQAQNQQDRVVMGGEQARDLADRQDRDNFYSNIGKDKSTVGTGLQETGKDLNTMKQQKVMMNLINQLSKYGITMDGGGNLGS